jgi:hypothetical protein
VEDKEMPFHCLLDGYRSDRITTIPGVNNSKNYLTDDVHRGWHAFSVPSRFSTAATHHPFFHNQNIDGARGSGSFLWGFG